MAGVEESAGEEVDIIQSALQESSVCMSDVEWTSDTLNDVNPPIVDTTEQIIFLYHIYGSMPAQANRWMWKLVYCPHTKWRVFMAYNPLAPAPEEILGCQCDPLKVGLFSLCFK